MLKCKIESFKIYTTILLVLIINNKHRGLHDNILVIINTDLVKDNNSLLIINTDVELIWSAYYNQ